MSTLKLNIVILGAGNVAWHLSKELQNKEQNILQVYNRSEKEARSLSRRLKCDYTTEIDQLNQNADLYILTVKDSVIAEVADSLSLKDKLIVHTSGAIDQDVIKHKRRGVFYPLQTFTKKKKLNFGVGIYYERFYYLCYMDIMSDTTCMLRFVIFDGHR